MDGQLSKRRSFLSEQRDERMGWLSAEPLRYFHPITGEEITREEWERLVHQRAQAMNS